MGYPQAFWKRGGDCFFEHDPDHSAIECPPLWSPRCSPTTLTLVPAEPGFPDLHPIPLDHAMRIAARPDGRGIVIADDPGPHYLWVRDPQALSRPAIHLPADRQTAAARIAIAEHFLRFLAGRSGRNIPIPLRLTTHQIALLIQRLHALDFVSSGALPRDIAFHLLDRDAHAMRAVE